MSNALQRSEDLINLIKSGQLSEADGKLLLKKLFDSLSSSSNEEELAEASVHEFKQSLDSTPAAVNNRRPESPRPNSAQSFATPLPDSRANWLEDTPFSRAFSPESVNQSFEDDEMFVDASSTAQAANHGPPSNPIIDKPPALSNQPNLSQTSHSHSPLPSQPSLTVVDNSVADEIRKIHTVLQEHSALLRALQNPMTNNEATNNTQTKNSPTQIQLSMPRSPSEATVNTENENQFILKIQNPCELDKAIAMDSISGNYLVRVEIDSAASVVRTYCKQFNPDEAIISMRGAASWGPSNKYYTMTAEEIKAQWEKLGQETVLLSDNMHKAISHFYNNESIEFEQVTSVEITRNFIKFHDEMIFRNRLKPYRSYWHIHDSASRIATTIEMAFLSNPNNLNQLTLFSFKRIKELKIANTRNVNMFKPLDYLPDTNFIHYSLELNIGRYILEKNYGRIIDKMYIILLHPELKTYGWKEVPRMDRELQDIVGNRVVRVPIVPKNLALSTVVESPTPIITTSTPTAVPSTTATTSSVASFLGF